MSPGWAQPEFVPPPNRVGESAWLQLDHQLQEKNLCVPTSASIILSYFGDSVSPRELKALSRDRPYRPEKPFSDFTLTMFGDLIAGLATRGYAWRKETYANNQSGFENALSTVTGSLDQRVPVMIDTTTARGEHTFVVAGYSNSQQAVYAVDPSLPAPGVRPISFTQLRKIWNSQSVGSNRRAVIIPAPRAAP